MSNNDMAAHGPLDRGVRGCKDCECDLFYIRMLYVGYKETLFLVECSECRSSLIPVVTPYGATQEEVNAMCLDAWNRAQDKTPNCNVPGAEPAGEASGGRSC